MSVKLPNALDHLYTLAEPVTAEPFTISAWFKIHDIVTNRIIVAVDTPDIAGYQILGCLSASGNVANDPVRAYNYNGSAYGVAATSTGFTANTWYHACGVFTSNVLRAAFIDGGSKGNNADNRAGTPSELVIGRRRRNSPIGTWGADGTESYIAEIAVYNAVLSDADVALLAGGTSPQDITNLVAYWPLLNDGLDDVGSNDLSSVGSPIYVPGDHPSISPPAGGNSIVVNGSPLPHVYLYELGELEMTSGDNSGQKRPIALDSDGIITVLWPFVTAIQSGDNYNLYPGCDLRGVTCHTRFNNADTYRGFLHVRKVEDTIM